MGKHTKLELTWIGKDNRLRLEPRILIEAPEKSYHAPHRVSKHDIFDNVLIHGDNLLALKALEQEFSGKIKCIYIDPPFNTGQVFSHYDDGIEHSLWLSMMRARVELLSRLLCDSGVIFVHLDDNEQAYFKVVMDEIFGRANCLFTFIWRNVDSPNDNKVPVAANHNSILCFAKNAGNAKLRPMEDHSILDAYPNKDEHGQLYRDRLLKKNGKNSLRSDRPSMFFQVTAPDGTGVYPIHDDGREARWACSPAKVQEYIANDTLIWKQREKNGVPVWIPYTREFAPVQPSRPYPTIWHDLNTTRQAKAHLKKLLPGIPEFPTPKPEDLIARIIEMSTNPNDWVLDSFAGSGTTGAVAHKMGRRWIMVELGEHCHTHIIPRLQKVIDGKDPGGITAATNWQGGGGFRYYRLGPSLIVEDAWGNPVINPAFNAAMLAEAMCKLEGFTYAPSEDVFWMHGRSTEQDFIYVTTQFMSKEMLTRISDEVGPDRSLLIYCTAFRCDPNQFPNFTLKKIPNAVLTRCEWGKDDYSLAVANLPPQPVEPGMQTALFEDAAP